MVGRKRLLENVEPGIAPPVIDPIKVKQIRELELARADERMIGPLPPPAPPRLAHGQIDLGRGLLQFGEEGLADRR